MDPRPLSGASKKEEKETREAATLLLTLPWELLHDERGFLFRGNRAVQFFFVSRSGVSRFRPADDIDPAYGAELRRAERAGVELLAYSARVRPDRLDVSRRIPIEL